MSSKAVERFCNTGPHRYIERACMTTSVFYVPALHRQAAPANTPPEAAFFPAMPEAAVLGACVCDGEPGFALAMQAQQAAALRLPLGRAEARSVLEDMLRQGEALAVDGQLRQMAALADAPDKDLSLRAEMGALNAFCDGGVRPSYAQPCGAEQQALYDEAVRRAMIDCQKVLLLAAFHEERSLEAQSQQAKADMAEKALRAALGEGGPGESDALDFDGFAESGEFAGHDVAHGFLDVQPAAPSSLLPWRTVVDAALPFLPENGVLLTHDDLMAREMHEAGFLQPVPEHLAGQGWSCVPADGLLYAQLPAWRLVGRKGPVAERPWLERIIDVFVMPCKALGSGGPGAQRSKGAVCP